MKKRNFVRIVSAVMVSCLLLTPNVVYAQNVIDDVKITTIEEQEIEKVIYDFFESFEDVEESGDREQMISEITKLSATKPVEAYQMQEGTFITTASNEESYLEMVQLLLERREIIENTSDIDLKEHKKEIEIETNTLELQGNVAKVDVQVIRRWYYSFSPDIQSAAADDFQVTLVKEDGNWKIQDIDGLSGIIMDSEIAKLGDEITREQREEYINAIEECFSYDLEHPVITEKAEAWQESVNTIDPDIDPKGYSMEAAINYALEYALHPNPDFPVFEHYDGTNFVSQVLLAGGVPMKEGHPSSFVSWYFTDEHDYSMTWVEPEKFRTNLRSTDTCCNSKEGNWYTVEIGDIVHILFQGESRHTMFVTGVAYSSSGKSDLLVCSHDDNRQHVSMNAYFGSEIKYYTLIRGNL